MNGPITVQPWPDYYVLGGALKSTAPSYVERQADRLLLDNIRKGEFCYVLTPRQMGKTSLMVRTSSNLRMLGYQTAIIDLTQLGTKLSAEQWYLGQLNRVAKDLKLRIDYLSWWQQQSQLGSVQRFITFLAEVALVEVSEPLVVFVDEIDTTLNLSFSDDYFAAIRSLYNDRATDERLDRLTFVLLGVASPSNLIQDAKRTPFNIGVRIPLTDFSESEACVLHPGLAPDPDSAAQLLKQVLFWTGGHPYLTQKTCREIANWAASPNWDARQVPLVVDDIVRVLFFSDQGRNQDFNMQFVRDRILESEDSASLLRLYRRIRTGETVPDDELDPSRVALKLSGLVVATDARLLQVRNRIYDRVFDDVWITKELNKRSPRATFWPFEGSSRSERSTPSLLQRLLGGGRSSAFTYDAFLSYSTRDREWVRRVLVPNLKRAGLKVFSDQEIQPGSEWERALDQGFTHSRCIVLVMSPDYFASNYTQLEVERALRSVEDGSAERRVLPILLRSVDVPPSLSRLQYIDFRKGKSGEAAMSQLVRALGGNEVEPVDKEADPFVQRTYDTGIVRRLLDEAMDTDDLNAFVYDYFRDIRDRLDAFETKKGKIQALIEAVEGDGEIDRLLDLMARNYPAEYRRFADLLQRLPS